MGTHPDFIAGLAGLVRDSQAGLAAEGGATLPVSDRLASASVPLRVSGKAVPEAICSTLPRSIGLVSTVSRIGSGSPAS